MTKYSFWIGLWKTVKNSAYLLVPFGLAVLAGMPVEYAWITGPIVYFLKNYIANKQKNLNNPKRWLDSVVRLVRLSGTLNTKLKRLKWKENKQRKIEDPIGGNII